MYNFFHKNFLSLIVSCLTEEINIRKIMLVFSVETSCDETSVCIMNSDKKILSHIVYSQDFHTKHGGVVPELASRAHLEILQTITKNAFNDACKKPGDIDVYSATCGPGLIGGLLIGSTYAKSLSIGSNKPFVPINHLEGHIFSTSYNNDITYPHLSLLVTGGHTQIYLTKNINSIDLIGDTIDDAVGEAFDKVAKLLGLPYPGGKEIEERAKKGDEKKFKLPLPLIKKDNFNFSFSGLKTAVNLTLKKNVINEKIINDMCASFQKCIAEILYFKLKKTTNTLIEDNINITSVSLVGGVANNKYIQSKLFNICKDQNIELMLPIKEMISDNAAMIAWACILKNKKRKNKLLFNPNPRLTINNM